MNDELTPREHSEMRDSILAGAQRIHSTGQRRMQLIAASVAFVLVAGISGGAVATAALLGSGIDDGPVATPTETAEPSPTATPTPTPSATATPTPTPAPSTPPTSSPVLGGECLSLLSAAEASDLLGVDAVLTSPLTAGDPEIIGGVGCRWAANDETWTFIRVAAYPAAAVPADLASIAGVKPECIGGAECAYAEFAGDAWVYASGMTADQVVRAVETMAPRAAQSPGVFASIPESSWDVPPCEEIRELIGAHLGRNDLRPFVGDSHPAGMEWRVQEANGVVSWCSSLGDAVGEGGVSEEIEVYLVPGASSVPSAELESSAAVAIDVPRAESAWMARDGRDDRSRLVAVAGSNVILVTARYLDEPTIAALAGSLIEHLDAANG